MYSFLVFAGIGAGGGFLLAGTAWTINRYLEITTESARTLRAPVAPAPVKDEKLLERPPTLSDLFTSDFPTVMKLTNADRLGIQRKNGETLKIKTQLYADFPAKAQFVGFYVPTSTRTYQACLSLADAVQSTIQAFQKSLDIRAGYRDEGNTLQELTFSGRVILYHEDFLSIPQKADIIKAYAARHCDVQFRGPDYLGDQVIAWHQKHDAKATR